MLIDFVKSYPEFQVHFCCILNIERFHSCVSPVYVLNYAIFTQLIQEIRINTAIQGNVLNE